MPGTVEHGSFQMQSELYNCGCQKVKEFL